MRSDYRMTDDAMTYYVIVKNEKVSNCFPEKGMQLELIKLASN